MNILTRTLFLFTIALLVGACSSTPEKDPKSSELEEVTTKTSDTRKQEPLVLFENSFYNQPFGNKRFSFKARGLPIKDALSAFSKLYSINILADSNVSGSVNVDFSN
ncbi:MAG: hypothetical protein OEW97_07700, partial [Gammaproteobacteria bacterium]|nr:hypothetical protein [Gammaproteobacteria bacterium]